MSIRTRFNPLGTIGRKSLLPAGYIELEYLESTGAQYIDTGVLPWSDMLFYIDAEAPGAASNSSYALNGSTWNNNPGKPGEYRVYPWHVYNAGVTIMAWGDNNTYYINETHLQYTGRVKIRIDGTNAVINGDIIPFTVTSPAAQCGDSIYIFNRHNPLSGVEYSQRIYEVRLDNHRGGKVRMIPALDPNGRPCMFDTVTKQPFYNQGTGEFRCGYKLPRGYTSVSAIYAPGNYTSGVMTPGETYPQFTHYIDTGYSPTNLTRVDVNATYVTIGNMGCSTFGASSWAQGKKRFHIGPSNNQWSYGLFDSNVIYGGSFTPGTNYNITVDAKNSKVVINGTQLQVAHTSNDMAGIASFCLFVRKDLDGVFEYAHDMYLYSCKIYEDDKLVRIYAPAYRDSDGVNGLYELKTRTFISNARGAANFTALQ